MIIFHVNIWNHGFMDSPKSEFFLQKEIHYNYI